MPTHECEIRVKLLPSQEMNNAQMLDKLKMFEKLQQKRTHDPHNDQPDLTSVTNISLNQPLRNCQSIQQQLDRLKELMENVFSMANESRQPNAANSAGQTDSRRNNQVFRHYWVVNPN